MGEKMIDDCIEFARKFLVIPEDLKIEFDDCPSERFRTMDNSSETNGDTIWFNRQWYQKRLMKHQDDIEFYVFHELRHVHQIQCVRLKNAKQHFPETFRRVQNWENGLTNYTRNEGGESQNINLAQEIEIDANAYGIVLVNLYHMDDGMDIQLSLPDEASKLAEPRVEEYLRSEKMVKAYFEEYRARKQMEYMVQQAKKGRKR